mmetsp:Transcript_16716/g.38280  ORF Transcript_16716/g.38280 Transcript_16716/m.38280 type:complete len:277 (+) Transcript_16716:183-1013(+)
MHITASRDNHGLTATHGAHYETAAKSAHQHTITGKHHDIANDGYRVSNGVESDESDGRPAALVLASGARCSLSASGGVRIGDGASRAGVMRCVAPRAKSGASPGEDVAPSLGLAMQSPHNVNEERCALDEPALSTSSNSVGVLLSAAEEAEVASAADVFVSCSAGACLGRRSRLHKGQLAFSPCRWIHTSMHGLWKRCTHGSSRSSSPSSNSHKHMAHVLASFGSRPSMQGMCVSLPFFRTGSAAMACFTSRVSADAARSNHQKQRCMYQMYIATM